MDSSTLSTRLRGRGPLAALALAGCLNTDAQVNATFGDTLMDTLAEPPGDNCPEGGIQIRLGPDRNANGTLDPDEVTQQEFLCTGAGGGAPLAVATDEPPGDNCANGGTRLDVGNDANGDGLLGADEITETVYLCDDAAAGGFQEPARVVTGARRSCAIRAGGALVCWGEGYFVTNLPERGTFVDLDLVSATEICGLDPSGALSCWSDNMSWEWPAALPGGTFTDWSGHCGLRTDGTVGCLDDLRLDGTYTAVAATACNETHSFTYCPRYACGVRTDGTVRCVDESGADSVALAPPAGTFTQVSIGYPYDFNPTIGYGVPFACGVRTDGTLDCWGNRRRLDIMPIPTGTFQSVSAGLTHACGLRTDGTVACWGSVYPLGFAPFDLSPQGTFRDVDAGWDVSCAIRTDGELACWGWCDETGTCNVPADVYR